MRRRREGCHHPGVRVLAIMIAGPWFMACASVPQEAVELSVTVGRDLTEVHKSHRALADRYFDRMESDIRAFVEETYRPFIIEKTMTDLDLLSQVDAARLPGAELDPLDVMEIFAEETLARIQTFQDSLLAPIRVQRAEVTQAIDDAYEQLRSANAVVTGHLASVRKVHDAQAELLRSVGLAGLRESTIRGTADLSERLSGILQRTERLEGQLDALPSRIRELVDSLGVKR